MRMTWLRGSVLGAAAFLVAAFAAASPANAASIPNVCINSVTADKSDLGVVITANAPASVAAGDSVSLENIDQSVEVPPSVFLTGYNLGLLAQGLNQIPADVRTQVQGTNTVEGTQETNEVSSQIETTITDPDGTPGTGDESATPGSLDATYDNQTWTAGGPTADAGPDQTVDTGANVALDGTGSAGFAGGTINFGEKTVTDLNTANPGNGGVVIRAVIGGVLPINFACSPGMASNGDAVFDDPSTPFANTDVDPGDPISTYNWTQTSGPAVSLSGANTATPSFTAPSTPSSLAFELEVGDGTSTATDTVAVAVVKSQACTKAEKKLKKAKKKVKKAKKAKKKAKGKKAKKKAKKKLKKAKKKKKKAKKKVKKEC